MFRRFLYPLLFLKPDEPPGGDPPKDPPKNDPDPPADKTFTQADLDRIVKERLAKEKGKYADYDDLKTKAQRLEEIEQANATDAEKAAKRAEQAEAKVEAATAKLRHASLLAALADEGLTGAKARAAARLLDGVEYGDDGEPTNLADTLKAAKAEYGDVVFTANGTAAGDADAGKGSPDGDANVTPGLGRLMHAYSKTS